MKKFYRRRVFINLAALGFVFYFTFVFGIVKSSAGGVLTFAFFSAIALMALPIYQRFLYHVFSPIVYIEEQVKYDEQGEPQIVIHNLWL
jgi:hypothetical protein